MGDGDQIDARHPPLATALADVGIPAFERLGVAPVINACGIYTDLGGSCLSPAVWGAATEVNRRFASMTELLNRSGELIAELLSVEAARVVPGASAGIALSVGACMTRGDGPRMEQLPSTDALPDVVVMQRVHRYKYVRCARMTGARILEVDAGGGADALGEAVRSNVACVLHPAHLDGVPGGLPLSEVSRIAHEASVPVVVDAAYMSYPTELIASYGAAGGDLVCFSAKYFWGPNGGGFVYGSRALVDALRAIDFTGFESGQFRIFGRAFKMDRTTVAATLLSLAEWLSTDHDERWVVYRRRVERLLDALGTVPHAELRPACFTLDERLVDEPVNALVVELSPDAPATASELSDALAAGNPSIRCIPEGSSLIVCVETVLDDEQDTLAARLAEALGRPQPAG